MKLTLHSHSVSFSNGLKENKFYFLSLKRAALYAIEWFSNPTTIAKCWQSDRLSVTWPPCRVDCYHPFSSFTKWILRGKINLPLLIFFVFLCVDVDLHNTIANLTRLVFAWCRHRCCRLITGRVLTLDFNTRCCNVHTTISQTPPPPFLQRQVAAVKQTTKVD